MSSRPELPNPGNGNWWRLELDRDGDVQVRLMGADGEEIASTDTFKSAPRDEDLISVANELIRANRVQVSVLGDYKFDTVGEEINGL